VDVEEAIAQCQTGDGFKYRWVQNIEQVAAEFLARGEVVARAKGRMEFGARGLGNRSILARADSREAVRHINDMIKSGISGCHLRHRSYKNGPMTTIRSQSPWLLRI
jgi:predicted NodU family carbamoyl transferase